MTAPKRNSYDVVLVGAGIVGLSCAWRAAQRGLSVLVVERDHPGAGASGVAAGMLAPVTEAEFGEEELLRLNIEAAAGWHGFAAELEERSGLATGYRRSGALVVAADRDDAEELRRLHRFQTELGLEADWLSGRDCRRLEPGLSPRVSGGVLAAGDHQCDPQAVVTALVAALDGSGGELLFPAAAELAIEDGRVAGVTLDDGVRVRAGHVVLAAGCRSGEIPGLPDAARARVRPVKGQILSLRAPSGGASAGAVLAERIVRSPRCYVLDRGDGRVVIGATVEERGFDASVTAEGVYRLLEAAWELLPDVGELELVEARAGLRPGTPDNGPLVGPAAVEGLVLATGHYRNGVLLAPITADAVADVLAGEPLPETFTPFHPGRHLEREVREVAGRP